MSCNNPNITLSYNLLHIHLTQTILYQFSFSATAYIHIHFAHQRNTRPCPRMHPQIKKKNRHHKREKEKAHPAENRPLGSIDMEHSHIDEPQISCRGTFSGFPCYTADIPHSRNVLNQLWTKHFISHFLLSYYDERWPEGNCGKMFDVLYQNSRVFRASLKDNIFSTILCLQFSALMLENEIKTEAQTA